MSALLTIVIWLGARKVHSQKLTLGHKSVVVDGAYVSSNKDPELYIYDVMIRDIASYLGSNIQ